MTTSAWNNASLIPHGNMISRTSCIELVSIGPTDVVSMARHWNMGASKGAFFLLPKSAELALVAEPTLSDAGDP